MANFPTTTEELEEYISDYMDAHIAERIAEVTTARISEAVTSYMQELGAAIEDNGENGDVPLVADNALDPDNASIPMARLSNGVPVSYFQARVSALVLAAARLVVQLGASNLMVLHASSETIATISPNILHVWSYARSLTIFLERGVADRVNEYMLQFMVAGDDRRRAGMGGRLHLSGEHPEQPGRCSQVGGRSRDRRWNDRTCWHHQAKGYRQDWRRTGL